MQCPNCGGQIIQTNEGSFCDRCGKRAANESLEKQEESLESGGERIIPRDVGLAESSDPLGDNSEHYTDDNLIEEQKPKNYWLMGLSISFWIISVLFAFQFLSLSYYFITSHFLFFTFAISWFAYYPFLLYLLLATLFAYVGLKILDNSQSSFKLGIRAIIAFFLAIPVSYLIFKFTGMEIAIAKYNQGLGIDSASGTPSLVKQFSVEQIFSFILAAIILVLIFKIKKQFIGDSLNLEGRRKKIFVFYSTFLISILLFNFGNAWLKLLESVPNLSKVQKGVEFTIKTPKYIPSKYKAGPAIKTEAYNGVAVNYYDNLKDIKSAIILMEDKRIDLLSNLDSYTSIEQVKIKNQAGFYSVHRDGKLKRLEWADGDIRIVLLAIDIGKDKGLVSKEELIKVAESTK